MNLDLVRDLFKPIMFETETNMVTIGVLDTAARAEEKRLQREKDMADILSGRRTVEEVREANTMTPRNLRLDWSKYIPGYL